MAKSNKIKNVKKHFRNAVICLTAVASLVTLTGCSPNMKERSEMLSDNIVTVCNEQVVELDLASPMVEFQLIGTDVEKTGFDFDVNFNGVASYEDNSIGYTTVNYTVPASYFSGIKKDTNYEDVYNVFDAIVNELDPNSIAVSPVSDMVKVNDAFIKNEPADFGNYSIRRGLLFELGVPEFDDATNTVDFDMKSLVDVRNGRVSAGVGFGIGFSGGAGIGLGFHSINRTGTFVLENNYKFTVDKETYEKMKNDHSLVYDYCVQAINEKDATKISAERISTTSVTYDSADLLNKLDIGDIQKELGE